MKIISRRFLQTAGITCLVLLFIFPLFLIVYDKYIFVDSNFKYFTKINKYKALYKYRDKYQWYAIMKIDTADGNNLQEKFRFENKFDTTQMLGHLENPFIKAKPNYRYYFEDHGHGPYGYMVFCMKKTNDTLEVYELFGD